MKIQTFTLINRNGLGSRASTSLVSEANKYPCELFIRYKNECANLKSIMNVLALVIRHGEEFEIEAIGENENIAFDAMIISLKNLNLI